MKRFKTLTFVLFAILLSGCATTISTSDIEFFGTPGGSFTVENPFPYRGPVMVADKVVGDIEPGGTVFDKELVSFRGMDMPVVVALYDKGQCKGLGYKKLNMYPQRSSHWRINRVKWLSGRKPDFSESSEKVTGTSKKVELSRPIFRRTTMVQVGNATPYKGVVEINGKPTSVVKPCDVFYLGSVTIDKYSRSSSMSVVLKLYKDGEVIGHSREGRVYTSNSRPTAYQFIWGPRDIRAVEGYVSEAK